MPLLHLQDICDAQLADYQGLKDRQLSEDFMRPAGEIVEAPRSTNRQLQRHLPTKFMAEGAMVVSTLVASSYRTLSLLCSIDRVPVLQPTINLLLARDPATPIYIVPKESIGALMGFEMHRGIMAIGQRPPRLHLAATQVTGDAPPATHSNPLAGLEHLAALCAPGKPMVILEEIYNHDNVGAAFRNAAAFGASSVILSDGCADPLYRKALRVSMGNALLVPFGYAAPGPLARDLLPAMHLAGIESVALTPRHAFGTIDLDAFSTSGRKRRLALLIGSEGPGLSAATLASASHRLSIAMAAGTDSLNAAVAGAVALHALSVR